MQLSKTVAKRRCRRLVVQLLVLLLFLLLLVLVLMMLAVAWETVRSGPLMKQNGWILWRARKTKAVRSVLLVVVAATVVLESIRRR